MFIQFYLAFAVDSVTLNGAELLTAIEKGVGKRGGSGMFSASPGCCREGSIMENCPMLELHTGVLCPGIQSSTVKTPNLQAATGNNNV